MVRFSRACFAIPNVNVRADRRLLARASILHLTEAAATQTPASEATGWRLRLAADALRSTPKGVAEVAAEVGYESEAAFNRAFKRTFGLPPARFRREQRSRT